MLKLVDTIVRFAKRQSTATKFTLAVIGILLVSVGYIVRPWYPYRGFAATFTGLTMDLGVMFILYLEIQDMERGIDTTRERIGKTNSEVQKAKKGVTEAMVEIEQRKSEIEDMAEQVNKVAEGAFGDHRSANRRKNNLEDRLSALENYVDKELKSMKREFDSLKRGLR